MRITLMSMDVFDKERLKQVKADFDAKTNGTYCGEIPDPYRNVEGGYREDFKKPDLVKTEA